MDVVTAGGRWALLLGIAGAVLRLARAGQHAHAGPSAGMSAFGETVYLDARVGAAQRAAMKEVLDRFRQAEFDAEWDEMRARLGDDACSGRLERSDRQHRTDALAVIFTRAASARSRCQDTRTDRQHHHRRGRLRSPTGRDGRRHDVVFDAADLAHRRCRTTSGVPIDPADAVAASLVGHVRRVVLDGDGRCLWAGLPAPPMSRRPQHRMDRRWGHRPTKRWTPVPAAQPVQITRLPLLARPHRRLAHRPP
jgi:hypothetical protein